MVLEMSHSHLESLGAASAFLFDQYDVDGDGLLSQFDFSLFLWDLKSTSRKHLTKEQALRCWAAVDAAGAGRINVDEFKRGVALLWEHDFYVAGLPDLAGVLEEGSDDAPDAPQAAAVAQQQAGDDDGPAPAAEGDAEPPVAVEPDVSPSPESVSSVSNEVSRQNSVHLTEGKPAALTSSVSANSLPPTRQAHPDGLARHLSEGSVQTTTMTRPRDILRAPLLRRTPDSGSMEDLIQRLASAQTHLKQEEDEIAQAASAGADEDEGEEEDEHIIPAPRVRANMPVIDFKKEVVTLKRPPPNAQCFIRVYMDSQSYKTVAIIANSTAADLLRVIYDKMEVPNWEEGRYSLYEADPAVTPLALKEIKRTALIADVQAKGNRRIYFREVASIDAQPATPSSPMVSRPSPVVKQRSKLFSFLK